MGSTNLVSEMPGFDDGDKLPTSPPVDTTTKALADLVQQMAAISAHLASMEKQLSPAPATTMTASLPTACPGTRRRPSQPPRQPAHTTLPAYMLPATILHTPMPAGHPHDCCRQVLPGRMRWTPSYMTTTTSSQRSASASSRRSSTPSVTMTTTTASTSLRWGIGCGCAFSKG